MIKLKSHDCSQCPIVDFVKYYCDSEKTCKLWDFACHVEITKSFCAEQTMSIGSPVSERLWYLRKSVGKSIELCYVKIGKNHDSTESWGKAIVKVIERIRIMNKNYKEKSNG